ncbi:response regulator [Pelomonas sp. SE-A7]|uniref:hybrid sensor histidine kinase/response regulator n=1 Tax=Pelomonas sp. SE-A7 TaxID=3054953 RepID=UPI00259CAE12|nr:response regulator [Pelomonas sp. SE-A7]MDM4765177.1 response regulator [Pelomonas sp. SE-A7]
MQLLAELATPDVAVDSLASRPGFLADQVAGPSARRRALLTLGLSLLVFLALAPLARVQLSPVPAFIPIYETALVVNDLITAVLLFGQYRILRSRALLSLACGYLFTALVACVHALSFPGLFAPAGLIGGGSQTTAWLYMLWHAGFPLYVLAYVLLKQGGQRAGRRETWALPGLTVCLVAAGALLATVGEDWLPALMRGNRYAPAMLATVTCVWACSLLALYKLWRLPERSVLDLWLMVALSAWLFDIALSALLNGGRYDLGFYAGRIYGLIACSLVLFELLLENASLYNRLARQYERDRLVSAELEVARDAAETANVAKSMFLANMSHEIRTPMNAIVGLTTLMLETKLDGRQRDYMRNVHTSSKALLTLLNDILDYSKVEAGRMTLENEEFSPEETIENVGNLFAAKLEESGLELLYRVEKDVPQRLLGDALRLSQVLNNLVGNAIKFTPRGEIVIGLEQVARAEGRVQLRFSVSDTGVGLSKEQRQRLFESFSQGDRSVARKYGGTGLGLAICKRLVGLMDGEFTVGSTPGEGSCFSFTAWFGETVSKSQPPDLHRILGMRTLVVDNQPTGRLILQQQLQRWRFQVATASFGDEALHKLRRAEAVAPYELVLLDWKAAGHHFIEQLWPLVAERKAEPPILVVMVNLHAADQVQALLEGNSRALMLVKPVTPSRLFEAIVQLQHAGAEPPSEPAPRKSDWAASLQPLRGARVLLAEDNPVNQQIAMAFLAMGGLEVTVAANGVEAVDWFKRDRFDVILMDVQMPELDGIPATRLIRSLPGGDAIPIIAMTAAVLDEDRQECLAAGMNAHVSKPIDPSELIRTLLAWVPPVETGTRPAASSAPGS